MRDVKNKNLNENENKNDNENKKFEKNKIVKDSNLKELIEKPKEIKSPNWIDENKFKEILTIIDSNKFGYKNKIGKFKYIDIKDLVNNIKNNTISEVDAKKLSNTLKIIKNPEIEHRRLIPGQKELFKLFDLLDTTLTDKTLKPESQEEKNKKNEDKDEDEDDYYDYDENEDRDDCYDYENQNETIDQNKIIKRLNDDLDEIIDKSKSFEEQIKLLKKREDLKGYWPYNDYDDKELKSKYFKIELADMSNKIDEKLFEQIFGHTLIKLTKKLKNTTNKDENQIIVKNINKK